MPLDVLRQGCVHHTALFLVLVDGRRLRARGTSRFSVDWFSLVPTFVGHYILLCGYDAASGEFEYRDPAVALGALRRVAGYAAWCVERVPALTDAASQRRATFMRVCSRSRERRRALTMMSSLSICDAQCTLHRMFARRRRAEQD